MMNYGARDQKLGVLTTGASRDKSHIQINVFSYFSMKAYHLKCKNTVNSCHNDSIFPLK